jgi:hypothetical protein
LYTLFIFSFAMVLGVFYDRGFFLIAAMVAGTGLIIDLLDARSHRRALRKDTST